MSYVKILGLFALFIVSECYAIDPSNIYFPNPPGSSKKITWLIIYWIAFCLVVNCIHKIYHFFKKK